MNSLRLRLTHPIVDGWVSVEEVLDALQSRPPNVHVVITGRQAPQALADAADLVTEMREIEHPYQQGIKAMPGIDF